MASERTASDTDGKRDGSGRVRAILLGVVLAFCGLLGGVLVAVVGIVALGALGVDVFGGVLLYPVGTILQGLGFGLVVAAYFTVSGRWRLIDVGVPSLRDLGWTVLGVVALLGAVAAIGAVFARLDVSTAQNQIEQVGARNPEVLLYMIPLAFLVIGPGEELLFRGAVQGVLRGAFGAIPAVVLASALFAVAHVTALIGSASGVAAYVAVVFCLGAILGAVYERTNNLVVPSLIHGAYNAFVFFSLYVQSTGALPTAL